MRFYRDVMWRIASRQSGYRIEKSRSRRYFERDSQTLNHTYQHVRQ